MVIGCNTNRYNWWLLSANSGNSGNWANVSNNGNANYNAATNSWIGATVGFLDQRYAVGLRAD